MLLRTLLTLKRLCVGLALLAWLVACAAPPERLPGAGNSGRASWSGLPRDREPVASEEARLLRGAEKVLRDMTARSRPGIPFKLRNHAKAIVLVPRLARASSAVRRSRARGVVIMRSPKTEKWGRPMFVTTSAAGWGLPENARAARLALLAVTPKGVERLLNTPFNKASGPKIALGPRGATGQLNVQRLQLANDIYAYVQAENGYVGLAFHAPSFANDKDSDDRFYGPGALRGASFDAWRERLPEAAGRLVALLDKIAPPPKKAFRSVRVDRRLQRYSNANKSF